MDIASTKVTPGNKTDLGHKKITWDITGEATASHSSIDKEIVMRSKTYLKAYKANHDLDGWHQVKAGAGALVVARPRPSMSCTSLGRSTTCRVMDPAEIISRFEAYEESRRGG